MRAAFKSAFVDAALRGVISFVEARALIVRYRLQGD
jgi:hypothetical protein